MKVFPPFEIKFQTNEHVVMRWAFAAVIFISFRNFPVFSSQNYPVGLAQFADLTFLSNPAVHKFLYALFLLSLLAYGGGRFLIVALGYLLFYTVSLVTLEYSQGAVNHGYQIVSLVILAQLTAQIYGRFLLLFKIKSDQPVDDLTIAFTRQMIAAVYVVAGLSKLIESGFVYGMVPAWVIQIKYMAVEIIKTHDQSYYNHLHFPIMERGDQIAQLLIDHQWLSRGLFTAGLLLELGAFLMLINRSFSTIIGMLLIGMHIAVGMIMNLHFTENIFVLLIFTIHLPWLKDNFIALIQGKE